MKASSTSVVITLLILTFGGIQASAQKMKQTPVVLYGLPTSNG